MPDGHINIKKNEKKMKKNEKKMKKNVLKWIDFLSESNFVFGDRVDKPKYSGLALANFNESHWDKRPSQYIVKILDVKKEMGYNNNEYFKYKVEIIDYNTNVPDFYQTNNFNKKIGNIVYVDESNMSEL